MFLTPAPKIFDKLSRILNDTSFIRTVLEISAHVNLGKCFTIIEIITFAETYFLMKIFKQKSAKDTRKFSILCFVYFV